MQTLELNANDLAAPDLERRIRAETRADEWWAANMVSSLDGAVAVTGRSGEIGGPADRRMFSAIRSWPDAIVAGAGTARSEGYRTPRLTAVTDDRLALGQAQRPVLVLVSRTLDLAGIPAIEAAEEPVVACIPADTSRDKRLHWSGRVQLIDCGTTDIDPVIMRRELADRGYGRVLCEGGPALLSAVIEAGVLDELLLTLAPVVLGTDSGRLSRGLAFERRELNLDRILHADHELFLRYVRPTQERNDSGMTRT